MPLCSIRNCMQYNFFTMCACKDTVLFFPSETESSFLSTCKNHLYLKRRFFQDITYTDLWRREHSSYVQKFLRFVTGKKIRRHAFYVKCVFWRSREVRLLQTVYYLMLCAAQKCCWKLYDADARHGIANFVRFGEYWNLNKRTKRFYNR